jgi:hypothetical protein
MQTQIMNNVIAKTGSYGAANRTVMSNNHVDIRVFYNGTDALNTLQIQHAQGPQPTETGRSWATTAGQPHLTNPTTTIWIYTLNQWNALNGATPTSYDINQEDGTVHHELGHQVDQDWAQARTPPLTSSITNTPDPLWNAAIGYDAANISVADRNYAASQWPQLFVPGTTNWAPSEDFAEEVATEVGGGVIAAEDQWIQQHMTCSYWYAQTVEQNGGAEPAQLGAVACYGHTH